MDHWKTHHSTALNLLCNCYPLPLVMIVTLKVPRAVNLGCDISYWAWYSSCWSWPFEVFCDLGLEYLRTASFQLNVPWVYWWERVSVVCLHYLGRLAATKGRAFTGGTINKFSPCWIKNWTLLVGLPAGAQDICFILLLSVASWFGACHSIIV